MLLKFAFTSSSEKLRLLEDFKNLRFQGLPPLLPSPFVCLFVVSPSSYFLKYLVFTEYAFGGFGFTAVFLLVYLYSISTEYGKPRFWLFRLQNILVFLSVHIYILAFQIFFS